MTAVIPRVAVPPLAPVLDALDVMRTRYGAGSLHGLTPGLLPPVGVDWLTAAELQTPAGVDGLLRAAAVRWQAQPHAAAALAWKCYTYWLALPAVLGFATSRRVPLLTPDRVRVRYAEHQPFLVLAVERPTVAVLAGDPVPLDGDQDVITVDTEAELLALLRESLVDRHLTPLLELIRDRVHLGHRTLWGSLASGIAHGLSRAAGAYPGSALDVTRTVLSTMDIDELVDLTPGADGMLQVQRRTCCLAFTLPTPKVCGGCCIRDA